MKRTVAVAALVAAVVGPRCGDKPLGLSIVLAAHEHFRIVGTITKLTATEMDVKNKDSKTYTIDINKKTIVKRDKEKAELALAALEVGMTVVVDAYGDDEFDLEALDVRIVPPIGRKEDDEPEGLSPLEDLPPLEGLSPRESLSPRVQQ